MKLSICTDVFGKIPFTEMLNKVKAYGISAVEMTAGGWGGCCFIPSAEELINDEEKRKAFKKRYRVVEETVRETHAKIYPWLLEAVTVEKATYKRLKELGMPCGKSIYYEARREFYKLLSEKIP